MEISKAEIFGSRGSRFAGKSEKRRKNFKNSSGRLCPDRGCPHCVGNRTHATRKRIISLSFDE